MQPDFINKLPVELLSRFHAAIRMGTAASAVLLRHFNSQSEHSSASTKSGIHGDEGLVTLADIQAERAILKIVRAEFPDDGILAEESGAKNVVGNEYTWVVDPLDGTNNFAHGIPQFSISIACCRNGSPELGLIVDPVRNDWYVTVLGQGAWHNGKRARVSCHDSLDQSIIGVGFYYDRGEMMRATLKSIDGIFSANALGIRRFGSAALDLVNVGLGRFGGYFEYTLSPWDFAAGMLFVTEAGGQVTNCRLQPLSLKRTSVLATNKLLHETLGDIISRNCPTGP